MRLWRKKSAGGTISGAAERKTSRAAPAIAFHFQGRPVWTPRDYAALAEEGYERNAIVYRCVRAIAEAAASVPWLLYEGRRELETHPLLDLLARPSPAQSGADLLEEWYGYLQVAGNVYLECVSLGGVPRELYALRPDRMKAVPGEAGRIEAYDYSAGGRSVRFHQEDGTPILHLKLFHPGNDYYGLSPMEAAACAIDIHNAASGWNKALFDNAARPSGALIYKGPEGQASLSDEQFSRLKQELEENYQGAVNAGRPLLLEGGLDWKQMALGPKEMDFAEAKNAAAREIALAFGVPPLLLGLPGDNTYANFREANLAFWRQTVIPLVAKTAQALGNWLAVRYGQDLRLAFDLDAVPALASERDALWTRVEAASFLDEEEKRAAVGYGARE